MRKKCSLATEEQMVKVKRSILLFPIISVPVPDVPAPMLALALRASCWIVLCHLLGDCRRWAVLLRTGTRREYSWTVTQGNRVRSFRMNALERKKPQCIKNMARFPFKCTVSGLLKLSGSDWMTQQIFSKKTFHLSLMSDWHNHETSLNSLMQSSGFAFVYKQI